MKKILLVDDDSPLTESARDILEDADFAVETAATLAEARAILARWKPDIVVTDFNLPDGKGLTLALEVRQLIPNLKCVLMSGEKMEVGDAPVFDAVLTKPVDPATFLTLLAGFDASI